LTSKYPYDWKEEAMERQYLSYADLEDPGWWPSDDDDPGVFLQEHMFYPTEDIEALWREEPADVRPLSQPAADSSPFEGEPLEEARDVPASTTVGSDLVSLRGMTQGHSLQRRCRPTTCVIWGRFFIHIVAAGDIMFPSCGKVDSKVGAKHPFAPSTTSLEEFR